MLIAGQAFLRPIGRRKIRYLLDKESFTSTQPSWVMQVRAGLPETDTHEASLLIVLKQQSRLLTCAPLSGL